MLIADLTTMCGFDCWANRRVAKRLSLFERPSPRAVQLFAHLLSAQDVWLTRMEGGNSAEVPLWPRWTPAECADKVEACAARVRSYVLRMNDARIAEKLHYRDREGREHHTRVSDIFTHLIMHGMYHRGQIALLSKKEGEPPLAVDYIAYVRERDAQA
jgi:uncharacterized damage-inducible protein DinB